MMPNELGIRTNSAENSSGLSLPVSNKQESRTVLSSITSYVVALGIQALIPTVAIPTFSWMWMPCGGFLIVPMVFETVTKFLQSSFRRGTSDLEITDDTNHPGQKLNHTSYSSNA
jgi:hypothetical protein